VSTAIVRCDDLEVFDLSTAITVVVLDTYVRKLDVLVVVRQPVRQGPVSNLVGRAIGSPVAVPLLAIALLQEPLILALQLVVEDHAPNMATACSDLLCCVLVGTMKVSIVCDFWSPREACIEALAIVE
jgi:hypothetical protein